MPMSMPGPGARSKRARAQASLQKRRTMRARARTIFTARAIAIEPNCARAFRVGDAPGISRLAPAARRRPQQLDHARPRRCGTCDTRTGVLLHMRARVHTHVHTPLGHNKHTFYSPRKMRAGLRVALLHVAIIIFAKGHYYYNKISRYINSQTEPTNERTYTRPTTTSTEFCCPSKDGVHTI